MTEPTPAWLLFAYYCHAHPDRGKDDHHIITGNWPALMAQCSHTDLRPVRVRGERRERRMAG